jgi:AcrR family transcriptional regulator
MKKQKKLTNRDLVMQAATDLFLTKGYLATSMDEIVAVSKVSKTNIYYYFKSKEDLLTAILEQLIHTYNEMIQKTVSRSELSVQERFTALLQVLTGLEWTSLAGCPFLTLYTQMPQDADVLREKVSAFFREQMLTVEALLIEGVHNKEFLSTLPTKATAQLIVSTIEGGLFLQHASQDPAMLDQTLSTLALLLK